MNGHFIIININEHLDERLLLGFLAIMSLTQGERGRIVIYKGMCDLLWTLWCALYTLSLTIRS